MEGRRLADSIVVDLWDRRTGYRFATTLDIDQDVLVTGRFDEVSVPAPRSVDVRVVDSTRRPILASVGVGSLSFTTGGNGSCTVPVNNAEAIIVAAVGFELKVVQLPVRPVIGEDTDHGSHGAGSHGTGSHGTGALTVTLEPSPSLIVRFDGEAAHGGLRVRVRSPEGILSESVGGARLDAGLAQLFDPLGLRSTNWSLRGGSNRIVSADFWSDHASELVIPGLRTESELSVEILDPLGRSREVRQVILHETQTVVVR